MDRRTLLKSAVAVGAAVPAASLLGAGPAQAAISYDVAVCEQYRNQVQIYTNTSTWTTPKWIFSPGGGGWSNLSDVKFRSTAAFGEIALFTASGGNVGLLKKSASGTQGTGSLLWSASPGDNPHAIERIPNVGAIVTASTTPGKLSVYAPTAVSDPSTLALVQTISFPGAHGLWFDDVANRLWAIGQDKATSYPISGTYRSFRLGAGTNVSIGSSLGHSLDAAYNDSGLLLASRSGSVISIQKTTHVVTVIHENSSVKSFSMYQSGEAFWVQATGKDYHGDTRNWVNPNVQFFDPVGDPSFTRGLSYGAEFYKARLHNVNYH
ncbi:hypothetical protein Caci_2814 [Catenulispora acidiphila DSM 44928]|jgi:hypothetical protein|uniref:Tat pathway signal sequence domain protein n=1 Tax=Catenulispora acidiphila (strain DSM 44928 / JCM 14897 / NBRC 102108 / NRRL B-24433 / ID139908) TaxID=479433 RepID=C7Q149_CATAD|nr:hypothetical protein [Catenulispora acidiphila]ACU71724.1 hypothetical protein Caci_2814 [Catenulispora acidiphila DSM 44928]